MDRTEAGVEVYGAGGVVAFSARDSQAVADLNGGQAHQLFLAFDLPFDISFQVALSRDSARFQRASQRAGQSTRERGDDVVDRRGQRLRRDGLVECGIAPVQAEAERRFEPLDVSEPQGACFLDNVDLCSVDEISHFVLQQTLPSVRPADGKADGT